MSKTQNLLGALQGGRRLSGLDIWRNFGLYRASSVVKNLRNKGYDIKTEIVEKNGERYGVYYL